MTTIKKETRGYMVDAVLRHRYGKEVRACQEREQALALRLYGFLVPPKLREAMDAVTKIEPHAFGALFKLSYRVNGMINSLYLEPAFRGYGAFERLKYEGGPLPLPARMADYGFYANLNEIDEKLAEDAVDLMQDTRKLSETIRVAESEITAAFDTMNTVKKLTTQWPEVLPLVENLLPSPANRNLPTVPVVSLNAKFGLPPKVEAA